MHDTLIKISSTYFFDHEKEYEEAKEIINQFVSLMLALNETEIEIFKKEFLENKVHNKLSYNYKEEYRKVIYEKWCIICFNKKTKPTKIINSKTIGLALKEARENKGLKIIEVAERLQISPSSLSNYERRARNTSLIW